jgi:hypothetical protein
MKKYIGPVILMVLLLAMVTFSMTDAEVARLSDEGNRRCVGLIILLGLPIIVSCAIIAIVLVIKNLIIVIKNFFD